MSVYDRSMFRRGPSMSRGPRLSPQDMQKSAQMVEQVAAPMIQRGMAGIAQDMQRGIKQAKNYEEAINAFRGDEKPMKARKDELGTIVGPKDAKKTPDSVVALAQPAIQMKVMQGIGSMPQAPVKMQDGGVARAKPFDTTGFGFAGTGAPRSAGMPTLMDLYNRDSNRQLLEQIYPDTSEATRKSALGSLLLGAVAPAALRFASGTPLTEAIEPLPAAFAQAGLQAQQGKQAREQAIREGRFKLASDELANVRAVEAARAKRAAEALAEQEKRKYEARTKVTKTTPQDTVIVGAGTPFERVVQEGVPEIKYESGYRLNPNISTGYDVVSVKEGDKPPPGVQFAPFSGDALKYENKLKVSDNTVVRATNLFFGQQDPGTFKELGPDQLVTVYDGDGEKVQFPYNQVDLNTYTFYDPNETDTVWLSTEQTIEGQKIPANFPVDLKKSVINSLDAGTFSLTAPPAEEMVEVYNLETNKKETIKYGEYDSNREKYDMRDPRDTSPDAGNLVAASNLLIGDTLYQAGQPLPVMSQEEFRNLPKEVRTQIISKTNFDDGKLSAPTPLFKIGADGNRMEVVAFTQKQYEDYLSDGYSTKDDSNFAPVKLWRLKNGQVEVLTAVTLEEQRNLMANSNYSVYDTAAVKSLGNKAVALFPEGTVVLASNEDPIPMYNADGKRVVAKSAEEFEKFFLQGFDKTAPAPKEITKKKAYAEIQPLALKLDEWANSQPGDPGGEKEWTTQDQIDFDTYMSAIQSRPGFGQLGEEGGYGVIKPPVPSYLTGIVARAKQKDPNFNDYGILPANQQTIEELAASVATPSIIKDINYADAVGLTEWFKRNGDNLLGLFVESFGFDYGAGLVPTQQKAIETMNFLMTQTRTAALADLAGKQTEGIRQEISDLLFNPTNAGLTRGKVRKTSESMADLIGKSVVLKTKQMNAASSTSARDTLRGQILNLNALKAEWSLLARKFSVKQSNDPNTLQAPGG